MLQRHQRLLVLLPVAGLLLLVVLLAWHSSSIDTAAARTDNGWRRGVLQLQHATGRSVLQLQQEEQLAPVGGSNDGSSSSDSSSSSSWSHNDDPTQHTSWDAVPSYSSHYASPAEHPNACKVALRRSPVQGERSFNFSATTDRGRYVPFIGTSVVRDSQLLLLRLYYSIDFPVQAFVVVVGEHVLRGRNAIAYQIKHLQEYPQDNVGLVIITCEHHPSVSESWNQIFQDQREQPWGAYIARDTFWERGALAKLAVHGWRAAETGDVDVGFVTWSNMGPLEAQHNVFVMTNNSVARFGLWDENIFPALCEDLDMWMRMRLSSPPLKEARWEDVLAVHGRRTDKHYFPGAWLPDDAHEESEKALTHMTIHIRHSANANYFMRKWGCPSEAGDWMAVWRDGCLFKTPFNKSVPVWYWHTTKALRNRDRYLTVREVTKEPVLKQLLDSRSNEPVFDVPQHYAHWGGYFEKSGICRLSGYLGRSAHRDAGGRTMCT